MVYVQAGYFFYHQFGSSLGQWLSLLITISLCRKGAKQIRDIVKKAAKWGYSFSFAK